MTSENQWAYELENTVYSLVKAKTYKKLKEKYPSIHFTTDGSNSGQAKFPTVYIHLLTPVEQGQTLDGQSINALLATFQVDVTTNADKSDSRYVMGVVADIFKQMRFSGSAMPEFSVADNMHKSTARFMRVIGANDRLL